MARYSLIRQRIPAGQFGPPTAHVPKSDRGTDRHPVGRATNPVGNVQEIPSADSSSNAGG